jgi:hypothetical protein
MHYSFTQIWRAQYTFFQYANNLVSSSKPYKRVDTYIFLTTTNFIYYAIELQNNPPKKIKLQRGPWTG